MKMMKKLIILLMLLICASSVIGFTAYCGDSLCTVYTETGYDESDPANEYYCPFDCGNRVNETYCEDTYDLRSGDCPICSSYSTPTCTVDSVPKTALDTYCNGAQVSSFGGAGSSLVNNYWIIFLIIGLIIGFYYGKKKKGGK
jgi:hypothetical protein